MRDCSINGGLNGGRINSGKFAHEIDTIFEHANMKVYKFGGASVKDAAGIKKVMPIIQAGAEGGLLVVVSAMGKTTNALEDIMRR
jgi:hypothetical protein